MVETRPVAIVTGAGSGIGRAIAYRLAADGFDVAVVDRDASGAAATAGPHLTPHILDLTHGTAIADLVAALPRIDAVVNNAGIFDERPLLDLTPADFHRPLRREPRRRVQPRPPCRAAHVAGAKIVNIASRAYLGARNHAHYVASKAALVGLTRAMAMELAPRGILVNAVAPGLVDTPILRALSPERLAAQLALQPTGRAVRVETSPTPSPSSPRPAWTASPARSSWWMAASRWAASRHDGGNLRRHRPRGPAPRGFPPPSRRGPPG